MTAAADQESLIEFYKEQLRLAREQVERAKTEANELVAELRAEHKTDLAAARKTNSELHRRTQAGESKQVRALRNERDALLATVAEMNRVPPCDLPRGPKDRRNIWARLDDLAARKWDCAVIYPEEAEAVLQRVGEPRPSTR